jgi:hypothetical protein
VTAFAVVYLNRYAEWDAPTWRSMYTIDRWRRAIAIICPDCRNAMAGQPYVVTSEPRYAVERRGNSLVYHETQRLKVARELGQDLKIERVEVWEQMMRRKTRMRRTA